MSFAANTRFDNYEIIRPLGAGGMGEVWLAKDIRLDRHVAIKVLPLELTTDPARVRRFEQEARAASVLNHPSVCTIHALGQTTEGRHFIAMEYVEGETLRNYLISRRLNRHEILDIAVQIASALTAAHASGVVHRDLKPENIMRRPDGLVKVLDFGLAKLVATDASGTAMATRTRHTQSGTVVGTPLYMSPEQARGQPVDARTDVWALGVVLYEMVAGRPPFGGGSQSEVLAGILEHEPASLARFDPDVPHELQRIVGKTLRKDPERRYQVMKDLLLDLQALRDEVAPSAFRESPASERAGDRRRSIVPVTLIVVALAAAVAAVLWWNRHGSLASPTLPAPIARPFTRLTFDTGLQTDAAFSPDGRSIAYASDRGGNFDIWVRSIGGEEARQITTSSAPDTQPAWSPDGRSIVFRSERDGGGLFIVPAGGGAERQLTSFGIRPEWVSGGSEIFFRTGVGDVYRSVHIVSSDGATQPRQLLQAFLREGTWLWMAPHPDGRVSVLGVHPTTRRFGFFTVSPDNRSVTTSKIPESLPLHFADEGTRITRFQWDRDGHALYIEALTNQVSNIWRVRVEPTTLEWLSADRLTTGTASDLLAALSPDGTRIAYTSQRESTRLWTFPFDPVGGRITGKGTPITPEDGNPGNFELSRDGRKVAYTFSRAGARRIDLWMTNLDTGASEIISEGRFGGAWSPDSTSIAYAIRRPDSPDPGEWAVAVREVPGAERLIANWSTQHAFLPNDWTSDGRILGSWVTPIYGVAQLALWRQSTPPTDAPERILLADPRKKFWGPRFSPNGRWISFVAEPVEDLRHLEIGVASAAGSPAGEWTRIVSAHAWPDKPRWAPDGRTIYFISRHDTSFYNLWGIRFDSERGTTVGDPFLITHFDSPGFRISPITNRMEIDISSTRAVISMMSVSGNIWMLENVDR